MGLKPIHILRKIILLTTKNPLSGPFLRRLWLRGVLQSVATLARDYTAIIRTCATASEVFPLPVRDLGTASLEYGCGEY